MTTTLTPQQVDNLPRLDPKRINDDPPPGMQGKVFQDSNGRRFGVVMQGGQVVKYPK